MRENEGIIITLCRTE